MEMFTLSSMGYLDGPGRHANYEPGSGYLAKKEHWSPYNVEFPFFWLFESIEKRRIKENQKGFISKMSDDHLSIYISYPRPRW